MWWRIFVFKKFDLKKLKKSLLTLSVSKQNTFYLNHYINNAIKKQNRAVVTEWIISAWMFKYQHFCNLPGKLTFPYYVE